MSRSQRGWRAVRAFCTSSACICSTTCSKMSFAKRWLVALIALYKFVARQARLCLLVPSEDTSTKYSQQRTHRVFQTPSSALSPLSSLPNTSDNNNIIFFGPSTHVQQQEHIMFLTPSLHTRISPPTPETRPATQPHQVFGNPESRPATKNIKCSNGCFLFDNLHPHTSTPVWPGGLVSFWRTPIGLAWTGLSSCLLSLFRTSSLLCMACRKRC